MRHVSLVAVTVALALGSLASASPAAAQESLPPTPGSPEFADPLGAAPPGSALPPGTLPPGAYERVPGGPQGGPQGLGYGIPRYQETSQDGSFRRQHVVDTPRGQRTQTWEQATTETGYEMRRTQQWTAPDGTLISGQQRSVSGTDPYNVTRQQQITLRDGRTIEHTQVRTWDGTSGTMERSFVGPNGQTRETQRSWSPDVSATPTAEREGWLQRWNPFRKRNGSTSGAATRTAATTTPRSGFTMGTPNRGAAGAVSSAAGGPAAGGHTAGGPAVVRGSQHAHRPAWAGAPAQAMASSRASSPGAGAAMASRPTPSRGNRR